MNQSVIGLALALLSATCAAEEGASVVEFYGYVDCIELKNDDARVILCPAAGGRVLHYGSQNENLLHLPPGNEGWTWDGKSGQAPMSAGRFDIGPEKMVPKRPELWQGKWTGNIDGPRTATLTSPVAAGAGVQLTRQFTLTSTGTTLSCKQTIRNVTEEAVEYCHWSRTFLRGKGTCFIPLSKFSRYPNHFVRYDDGKSINYKPDDEHVKRVGDCLVITDRPQSPKLGFDSREGWLAYAVPQSHLFVKRFTVFPGRAYNEVAGLTISVWYPEDPLVELEPIGPAEHIEPGKAAAFTETWDFVPLDSPDPSPADVAAKVAQLPAID